MPELNPSTFELSAGSGIGSVLFRQRRFPCAQNILWDAIALLQQSTSLHFKQPQAPLKEIAHCDR